MPQRILIVEDEAHIVELVRVCLEDPEVEVLDARDGVAGLVLARQAVPDLVLLDVMMPRLDGFALCRTLKEDPRTQGIPVVMLTARTLELERQLGREAGADAYLCKPFSPARLRELVLDLLSPRAQAGPS